LGTNRIRGTIAGNDAENYSFSIPEFDARYKEMIVNESGKNDERNKDTPIDTTPRPDGISLHGAAF